MKFSIKPRRTCAVFIFTASLCFAMTTAAQQPAAPQNASAPALEQWTDGFDGNALDATKWETFAVEGGAANATVEGGQVRLRGGENSRAGIRSKKTFDGARFLVEATNVKAASDSSPNVAVLAVLFDDAGKSRIEWTLTGDGKLEAFDYTGGKSEKLDSRPAGAANTGNVKLGIARRDNDFYFTANDLVLFQRPIANVPTTFRVMLYASGATQNTWDTASVTAQKVPSAPTASASSTPADAAPVIANTANVWSDEFDGAKLDESKWEQYTFEGGGGLKIEVKDGQLRQRGTGNSRSGVRSKESFNANDFYLEGTATKPEARYPQPGESGYPPGYSVITVLFNGNATKRVEWILTSDGQLQAWATINDRMERLDKKNLGTRETNPKLGIARRGDQILFLINRQVGFQRAVPALPNNFKVMVYGFGTTQSNWDSVIVQTTKQ